MTENKNNVHNKASMEKNDKNNHKITLVYWEICCWLSAQLGSQIKYNVTRHFHIIVVVVLVVNVVLLI